MGLAYDIGHDHSIEYFGWKPDNVLANRERYGTPLPRVEKAGITIRHPSKHDPSVVCTGIVTFDLPEMLLRGDVGPHWKVVSWEPLTLEPSVRCRCGDHGYIREGLWVPA